MSTPATRSKRSTVLVDTNAIIESVRVGCWKALAGGLRIETVEECRDETRRGAPHRPGYVTVTSADLSRIAEIHPVTDTERATLALQYESAPDLDAGERDLIAHALARLARGDAVWVVCSPDKAAIRASVALGWGDRVRSLEELMDVVGCRSATRIANHFTTRWLSEFRTACILGR